MKKVTYVAIVLLSLCLSVVAVGEERKGFIPPMEVGGGTLALRGFAWWTVTSSDGKIAEDVPYFRIHAKYDFDQFGFGAVVNFPEIWNGKGNELCELWGKVKLTDNFEAYAGRLFLPSGYYWPSPDMRETLPPKAETFDSYAWGGMLVNTWEDGSTAKLALSGRPGVTFDSDTNWTTWCLSGRLEKKWDANSVGGIFEITGECRRFDVDTTCKPTETLTLRAGTTYEQNLDKKTSDRVGLYFFAAYRPIREFEVVFMIDYLQSLAKSWEETKVSVDKKTGKVSVSIAQYQSSDAHVTTLTIGGRFFPATLFSKDTFDWLSVTVDVRIPLENEGSGKDPSVWFKTQIAF